MFDLPFGNKLIDKFWSHFVEEINENSQILLLKNKAYEYKIKMSLKGFSKLRLEKLFLSFVISLFHFLFFLLLEGKYRKTFKEVIETDIILDFFNLYKRYWL